MTGSMQIKTRVGIMTLKIDGDKVQADFPPNVRPLKYFTDQFDADLSAALRDAETSRSPVESHITFLKEFQRVYEIAKDKNPEGQISGVKETFNEEPQSETTLGEVKSDFHVEPRSEEVKFDLPKSTEPTLQEKVADADLKEKQEQGVASPLSYALAQDKIKAHLEKLRSEHKEKVNGETVQQTGVPESSNQPYPGSLKDNPTGAEVSAETTTSADPSIDSKE